MLESDYSAQLTQLLATIDDRIELPKEWANYFAKRGTLRTAYNEQRRFVRHYYRTKAILEIQPLLPGVQREPTLVPVYMNDLSRCGASLIHDSQLFPDETCRLWLPNRKLTAIVVRSKRLNPRCWTVGLRWTGPVCIENNSDDGTVLQGPALSPTNQRD